MTLGKGDRIVKLDKTTGAPAENEAHVEYEVINTSAYSEQGLVEGEQTRIAVLKVVR